MEKVLAPFIHASLAWRVPLQCDACDSPGNSKILNREDVKLVVNIIATVSMRLYRLDNLKQVYGFAGCSNPLKFVFKLGEFEPVNSIA